MMPEDVSEGRTENLVIQLLETLTATILWIENFSRKTGIEIPNKEALKYLLADAQVTIQKITEPDSSDEFFHQHKSDGEVTESLQATDIRDMNACLGYRWLKDRINEN